ncbi:MAG: DUF1343 domain-containing protein [Bacteroidota bacterium]
MARFLQFFSIPFLFFCFFSCAHETQNTQNQDVDSLANKKVSPTQTLAPSQSPPVRIGAEVLLSDFGDQLTGKKLAIVANQTTRFPNGTHLVDSLLSRAFDVQKVFAPEHGFRGTADAGETVKSGQDQRTGLPIISLYGKNKKPSQAQLAGIDLVIFDIQDVGVRLYTYISTLSYVMEACAEAGIPIMVLDRPNPNGWYVDGPVLQKGSESFVGMHPIPVVHGMSIGEYAQMVNGEGWLEKEAKVDLTIIPCEGYTHEMRWADTQLPWVAPSPNLGSVQAAYMYPMLVWFEPTPVSVGRGTDSAFTIVGAPWLDSTSAKKLATSLSTEGNIQAKPISFTPRSLVGKSKYPKHQDRKCEGMIFEGMTNGPQLFQNTLQLIRIFYDQHQAQFPKETFFQKGFHKWPGNKDFQQQISENVLVEEIYESWQAETEIFRELRKKYLIYP